MARPSYAYGEPNWEMVGRWLQLPAEEDGPFWALNLMKYREVADYGDGGAGGDAPVSGKDADDAYAPLGPLAAIGAMVVFHGDVLDQTVGDPAWDRIGIVRYPSRAAFFAMQQRDDFKAQHTHKEAGMAFTIVMSCLPEQHADEVGPGSPVLLVERRADGAVDVSGLDGVTPVADFTVEGVIVGDERTWTRARFLRADGDAALAALTAAAGTADEAALVVVDPAIEHLAESITTAPAAPAVGS